MRDALRDQRTRPGVRDTRPALESGATPSEGSLLRPSLTAESGPVVQRARKGSRKAKRQEKERRLAALDRLNRGDPHAYDHLDPEVALGLKEIEANQPRKSAAKKNARRHDALLAQAKVPSIVEVGAGTGSGSAHLRDRVLKAHPELAASGTYLATDINPVGGKGRFLKEVPVLGMERQLSRHLWHRPADMSRAQYKAARKRNKDLPQISVKGGVDANRLEEHFPEHSISQIIGANAYGNRDVPGASYGLVRDTADGGTEPDDRFLKSAHRVLKPGGTARLIARSNFIAREHRLGGLPKRTLNKYLDPKNNDLKGTTALNFDVTARSIEQPRDVHFYRPDTHPGKRKELGEYNTEFAFKSRSGPGRFALLPREEDESSSDSESSSYESSSEDDDDGLEDELMKYVPGNGGWGSGF